MPNFSSKLNELNPQFLRELKGRLKPRTLLLAIIISFIAQVIFIEQATINDTRFYQVVFDWFSLIAVSVLLVSGSHALINDIANEEKRGTLNFIRLSPQSSQSVLFGKMLGVPIFWYIVILLAIPFHLWLGINANLPWHQILIFYVIVLAASIFYYSGALLFSLVGSWLGRFQAGLSSGFIIVFLLLTQRDLYGRMTDFLVILRLINPQYFIPSSSNNFSLVGFRWFGLPLGNNFAIVAGFSLLVYSIGTYFIWQSIERCYHAPHATMLSKKQSYFLTTSFTAITLGCVNSLNKESLISLIFLNFGLFLYLIAALTPNRQTLQDWARYQHIYRAKHPGKRKLIKDLIWGEKSPAILAIAINAVIVITSLSISISLSFNHGIEILNAVVAVIFAFSLLLIYAAFAQLMLFMKNEQRLLWTNTTLAAVICLPPIVLGILLSNTNHQFMWLFSIVGPAIILWPPNNLPLSAMMTFLAILAHATILGLLLFQTKRLLQKAGESATKALLTEA
ncbi:hypothetical protein [Nodularia sp. UHCC 0506]|uniref:hypothetical protein n=1 Tax=Nodularia sp. UHCC 0506 TaxID=3110243 RepID=UPI002B214D8A|nr:hypothetical protein [Nodularia sp. UHCC 0506]MEA5515270.1 hypothetical protein [Nodularia sp. UHCC 0506]